MAQLRRLGFAAALLLTASVTLADEKSDGLDALARSCESNVGYFRGRIDSALLWGNIFMIGGAIVSASGAAMAGILRGETQRKVAAVVGAIGAIVTVLPKALPDKEALQAQLSAAEKHRVFGAKVRNQFRFAKPDESITELQKYAAARFTDCASLSPPPAVPDLPSTTATDPLLRFIDSSKPPMLQTPLGVQQQEQQRGEAEARAVEASAARKVVLIDKTAAPPESAKPKQQKPMSVSKRPPTTHSGP